MRVGFFTEVYHPVVNGVVASIDALAHGLRTLGVEVTCFAPSAPGFEHDDPPVYRIPSLPLPTSTSYRLTVPRLDRGTRETVIGGLDIVHAHSPFVTGWMAAHYARRFRIPLVYTYHTRLEAYAHYVPFDAKTTRRAASTLTRTYANSADAVIVPTASMRDWLIELGVRAPIEVVPSGIDLPFFSEARRNAGVRAELGVRTGERLLLSVSRLAREKNIELLIEALSRSKTAARLVIAGEGPHREHLETFAAQCGVADRVHFLGEVERERLPVLYGCADAFVFASLSETQGLVLAEAMAAGALVIAADAPQVRDVMGAAGLVVEGSAHAFAAAFGTVPDEPDPEQSRLARETAAQFGLETQAGKVAGLYGRLARGDVRAGAG